MARRLRYTLRALASLRELSIYLAEASGGSADARRFISELRQKGRHLASFPGALGRDRSELQTGLLCFQAQAETVPPALAAKRSGVASQLTPSPLNTIFTPVTPCTVFDTTRTARLTKSFYVAGTAGFPSRGGTAGGCGVPDYATAVSLSLTAINGGNAGRLTVYPAAPRRALTSGPSHMRRLRPRPQA